MALQNHETIIKTGYLHSDFRLFYLKDQNKREIALHYHDFYKVLIFLGGNVSYTIEGRTFDLLPDDVVLVSAGEIHRPVIHDDTPYERIVIYISREYFQKLHTDSESTENAADLFYCFRQISAAGSNLIRTKRDTSRGSFRHTPAYLPLHQVLADSARDHEFASALLQKLKLTEYLILLNRSLLQHDTSYMSATVHHAVSLKIMNYINSHLTEELDIDTIAEHLFLTRYHIMHQFKTETGITIGKYITEKRLFHARVLIEQGETITEACYQSGFQNYSTFYRAFRNKYGRPPGHARK